MTQSAVWNDESSFGRRGLGPERVGEAVASVEGDEVVEGENFEAAHDGESVLRIDVAYEQPGGRVGQALAVPNAKRGEQSSARRVPDLDGDVGGPRGDTRAVWRERDGSHRPRMPVEGSHEIAARRVPELDGVVVAPRGDARAVRRER